MTFGDFKPNDALAAFGAHVFEVGVHAATGEVRIRRMLAVRDARRILNPTTARSQVIGGMTMGVGDARIEHLATDPRRGFFVNHDPGTCEVAVHADIPAQEVMVPDTLDPVSTPLKAKGVGALGLCRVAAAIADAAPDATGIQVRDDPIEPRRACRRLIVVRDAAMASFSRAAWKAASTLAGGMFSMGSSRRRLSNQSTPSSVACSTASKLRQGPRRRMTGDDPSAALHAVAPQLERCMEEALLGAVRT